MLRGGYVESVEKEWEKYRDNYSERVYQWCMWDGTCGQAEKRIEWMVKWRSWCSGVRNEKSFWIIAAKKGLGYIWQVPGTESCYETEKNGGPVMGRAIGVWFPVKKERKNVYSN